MGVMYGGLYASCSSTSSIAEAIAPFAPIVNKWAMRPCSNPGPWTRSESGWR